MPTPPTKPESRQERRARERREKKEGGGTPVPAETGAAPSDKTPLLPLLFLAFVLGVGITAILLKVMQRDGQQADVAAPIQKQSIKGKAFSHLLNLSAEEVASYDMAELNLLCGSGLNGTEDVDLDECLEALDRLVGMVRDETERNLGRFRSNPSEYQSSEAYYRMGMLITVIRQDFKAKYNPKLITDPSKRTENSVFFKDASNVFLQGLLTGDRVGTCASMPVLYVAVGRRLGYPVHLVSTKGHLFCRWEDDEERMNFEGTGDGVRVDPDEAYHKFPFTLTQQEIENSSYLKNLSRAQELAVFLDTRAACLVASSRNPEALIAVAQAVRLTEKEGLTGLMESMATGKMIPSSVFHLRGQPAQFGQAGQGSQGNPNYFDVDAFNQKTMRDANRRLNPGASPGTVNPQANPTQPR